MDNNQEIHIEALKNTIKKKNRTVEDELFLIAHSVWAITGEDNPSELVKSTVRQSMMLLMKRLKDAN